MRLRLSNTEEKKMAVGQPTASGTLVATQRKFSLWRVLVTLLLLILVAPMVISIGQQIVDAPGLLIQQLWVGLINGAIIAIIALGYTMVYGIIELINFAHGDVYMLGAFSTLILLALLGVTRSTAWYALYPALILVFVLVSGDCAGTQRGDRTPGLPQIAQRAAPGAADLRDRCQLYFAEYWPVARRS